MMGFTVCLHSSDSLNSRKILIFWSQSLILKCYSLLWQIFTYPSGQDLTIKVTFSQQRLCLLVSILQPRGLLSPSQWLGLPPMICSPLFSITQSLCLRHHCKKISKVGITSQCSLPKKACRSPWTKAKVPQTVSL